MDTKFLYVTAIAIAAVSGGYYYYSGKGNKLQAESSRSMNYSADNIHLTQTDENGKLYVRAQVDRLEQNVQQKTAQLSNLNASTYTNGQVDATFFAKTAKVKLVAKNKAVKIAVKRVKKLPAPEAPNTVAAPPPPNDAPASAPLPCCTKTNPIIIIAKMICTTSIKLYISTSYYLL